MENLVSEIVSIESDIRYEGTDFEIEYRYGYRVYDNHPLAEIKFIEAPTDAHLFLGTYEVEHYSEYANDFHYKVPVLYCVRKKVKDDWQKKGYHGEFVCGLDLTDDGRVWQGITRSKYNTIEEAMDFIQKNENCECVIFCEDKMNVQYLAKGDKI